MRKIITKYLGLTIQDFIKKTDITKTFKLLKKQQYLNSQEIKKIQFLKLQKLVMHSYNNVPYYKELFDKKKINPYIQSITDFEKIPILTKELARKNQSKLIATNKKDFKIKYGKTGGTTGVPLKVLKDQYDRSVTWASYYRWYNWIGINYYDKVLTFWGANTVLKTNIKSKIKNKIADFLLNDITINTFIINDKNIHTLYKKILKENPVLIKGYLSTIILLARYMKDNNLSANKKLKAVSSTTETLLPLHRELIENAFGVPIYNQYGCGEVSAISYQCKTKKGLHITEDHVYLEIMDKNDTLVTNQKGRIIATSLDNYIMPFIRYENGDVSSVLVQECDCGLPYSLMGFIEGRTIDTIELLNGAKVHGVFFTDIFFEIGITTDYISRFQIIQNKNNTIDILLETKHQIAKNKINLLKEKTSKFVVVNKITSIPFIKNEPSGKFKYIKKAV